MVTLFQGRPALAGMVVDGARLEAIAPAVLAAGAGAPTWRRRFVRGGISAVPQLVPHKPRETRTQFLKFCRYLRSLYPPQVRIAIICDNYSPRLTTRKDKRSSPRCGTSRSTAPTTPATSSRSA
jgi:hypothetical protein